MTLRRVATVGHIVDCPIHGEQEIKTGSKKAYINGMPVACVGDEAECGAVIEEGEPSVRIDGRPVAYLGCKTSHDGVIIEPCSEKVSIRVEADEDSNV